MRSAHFSWLRALLALRAWLALLALLALLAPACHARHARVHATSDRNVRDRFSVPGSTPACSGIITTQYATRLSVTTDLFQKQGALSRAECDNFGWMTRAWSKKWCFFFTHSSPIASVNALRTIVVQIVKPAVHFAAMGRRQAVHRRAVIAPSPSPTSSDASYVRGLWLRRICTPKSSVSKLIVKHNVKCRQHR